MFENHALSNICIKHPQDTRNALWAKIGRLVMSGSMFKIIFSKTDCSQLSNSSWLGRSLIVITSDWQ